jgi:hypothetical protein
VASAHNAMAITRLERIRALLVVAALMPWPLLAGPANWWAYALATAAILVALRFLLGQQWANSAGLKLHPLDALAALAAFALVAAGTKMLLPGIYAANHLTAGLPKIEQQFGFLFQAFNEEILFRALMIGLVLQYARSAALVSLGLAFVFSAAHFLLYRFGTLHMVLSVPALATLFFAGATMNNLYLAFRHIGFSWALHAGWNVIWLPAAAYDAVTKLPLHEPQLFNRVLGSPMIAAIAGATMVLSFVLLALGRRAVPNAQVSARRPEIP